ncbi:hypothetical protein [Psychrobacter celer]|uniref:hypothetical protein n=1 Tax=Psychrobacter celer TaxID=306572 RepID=UPI003FCFBE0B
MGTKLTKKQIDELKNKVIVELMCDGFKVQLVQRIYKNKVLYLLYVNGKVDTDWLYKPDEHIESKFYRPHIVYRKRSARSKKMEKIDLECKKVSYASVGQALRYLNKVCDSVELVSVNGVTENK